VLLLRYPLYTQTGVWGRFLRCKPVEAPCDAPLGCVSGMRLLARDLPHPSLPILGGIPSTCLVRQLRLRILVSSSFSVSHLVLCGSGKSVLSPHLNPPPCFAAAALLLSVTAIGGGGVSWFSFHSCRVPRLGSLAWLRI
jgi:hypothetical protein